ncbi:MAG: GNAT family N-acetyltransferase [Muribaculaceae bacterium]|nr:GNAT family N-acetyltransferase [Muribaculaceae bacterium]
MLTFRKGTPDDLPVIMEICDMARRFMRDNGNLTQWVNGYPSADIILKDMAQGNNYVAVDDDGDILLTFAFIVGIDPTYEVIEDGAWLNDNNYGTIHRMASSGKRGGMLAATINFCRQFTTDIRLDTHRDNQPMQNAALREGFKRCGVIICQDGTPREAFHLTLG